jgi:glycosyltransferase involved in cell wall biosynthesis
MRILFVTKSLLTEHSGIGRVLIGLGSELANSGIEVSYIDSRFFFPNGRSKVQWIFGPSFTKKLSDWLKKNSVLFDVIDYEIGEIIDTKKNLNFNGQLIARSHGFQLLHKEVEKVYLSKFLNENKNNLKLKFKKWLFRRELEININKILTSLSVSDFIIAINSIEFDFICKLEVKSKVHLFYHGLSYEMFSKLGQCRTKVNYKCISFIGRWSIYKGSHDLKKLISHLGIIRDTLHFKLLGLGSLYALAEARKSLTGINNVELIMNFEQKNLPKLLEDSRVGIFPSYMEGFGFSVLEHLAAGIPVVCYDIPGPSDILGSLKSYLTVPVGEIDLFIKKVEQILDLDDSEYTSLSIKCRARANDFLWPSFAKMYLNLLLN